MKYKFVKGTAPILGFQDVLKVDFSPVKTCNFDCIYCSVGRTSTWLNNRQDFFTADEVFNEIENYIIQNGEIKYILLTGSGEPALYKSFGTLVSLIKKKYPDIKLMAYTNGSLLSRSDVQSEFTKLDIIGCNLNAVYEKEFRIVSQAMESVHLKDILDGLLKFKKIFQGVLFIDTKFVHDVNDTKRNLIGLIEYINELKPDKYTIINRKYNGNMPSGEFISLVKEKITQLTLPTNIFP
ncbi:MAG: radical SAM protein [Asgard group archaeon]|nr:radical SAM protein [Asgard group archaeon]